MTKENIIFWIAIPIICVVIATLSFFLIIISKKIIINKSRDKKIKIIFEKINIDKLEKYNSEVTRISNLGRTNPKYLDISKKLTSIFDKMDILYKDTNNSLSDLNNIVFSNKEKKSYLNKYRMTTKEFDSKLKEVWEKIKQINKSEKEFEKFSIQITHQDDVLRSEFSHYQKNQRKAIETYKTKKILIDKIVSKVDDLILDIKKLDDEFENLILSGEVSKASMVLKNYSEKVIKFAKIVNKAPAIETCLFNIIPKTIEKVVKSYKMKQKKLIGSNEIINFHSAIKLIALIFQEAKNEYEKLNIEKTETLIKEVLKSIKSLEKVINHEIKARNLILIIPKDIFQEVKSTLKKFENLKHEYNKNVNNKKNYIQHNLDILFPELRRLVIDIDNKTNIFKKNIEKDNLPFSAKLSEGKEIMELIKKTIIKINETNKEIWKINSEETILKNKFRQAEAAINEIVLNVKKHNIFMDSEDSKIYNELFEKISTISKLIRHNEFSIELSEKISTLVTNATFFYKSLATKIQIAEMIVNLMKDFSAQRVANNQLNFAFIQAEKMFLEGKYFDSLNTIIREVEGNMS